MQETLVQFLGQEDPLEKGQVTHSSILDFPGGSDGKESTCNSVNLGSIPGLGRSPGGRNGNPLQYSCLENHHKHRSLAGYSPWGCRVQHGWDTKHSTEASLGSCPVLCLSLGFHTPDTHSLHPLPDSPNFFFFAFICIYFCGIYSQAISFHSFSFFWAIFFFCATSSSGLGTIYFFSVRIISSWQGEPMYGLIWPWAL